MSGAAGNPVSGDEAATGTLGGDFAVSGDGVASYILPLPLPPGTADLAPSLSLAYSSAGGNDMMGVGWRLSGLSAITHGVFQKAPSP